MSLSDAIYLIKIFLGIFVLMLTAGSVYVISNGAAYGDGLRWGITLLACVIFVGLIPLTFCIYKKMDELQQRMHQLACVKALVIGVTAAGVIGVLQSFKLIPLFNLIWFFFAGILLWAITLMLSDRDF